MFACSVLVEMFLITKKDTTVATYKGIFREWFNFIGGESKVFLVDSSLVWKYVSELKSRKGINTEYGDHYSIGTIKKKILSLKALYDFFIEERQCVENPFDRREFRALFKKRDQKRPTCMISFDLVRPIIESITSKSIKGLRDRAMLALLFYGGLRLSESIKLQMQDLKISHQGILCLWLRDTKNGEDKEHPLANEVLEYLAPYLERCKLELETLKTGLLFPRYDKDLRTGKSQDQSRIRKMFKKACFNAGVKERVSPHSARATAITKLLASGLTHKEVQEFSRHSSIKAVEIYDKRVFSIVNNPALKLSYK